jgi:hypothetical protein
MEEVPQEAQEPQVNINHVCSLGSICQASSIIKNNNLKLESYPFDWIFSRPDNVAHILNDNFKLFLDKESYIPHGCEPHCRKSGHSYYGKFMFGHHDPRRKEEDYKYYERCVWRFRQLLSSPNPKLFIMIFANKNAKDIEAFQTSALKVNEELKKNTTHFNLLAIFQIQDTCRKHELITTDTLDFCILYTRSKSTGTGFASHEDDKYLNTIIKKKYAFTIKRLKSINECVKDETM